VKLQFKKRRLLPAVLAIVVLVVGSGVAYAFWTAGGSGTGSASAGTVSSLTVNQTNAAITGMYPGQAAQALSGNFDNPNPGPIYVTAVTATVSSVDVISGTCANNNFVVAGTATVNAEIPSGTGVGSWSGLTIQLVDTLVNQDGCKGATVHLAYSAS
jgi:hypothetical protein